MVSTHSRPKAAAYRFVVPVRRFAVSTHSRPKAAAFRAHLSRALFFGFNTQPPEGGCCRVQILPIPAPGVSTHSRPKAAAKLEIERVSNGKVSTHSRPKAAASRM